MRQAWTACLVASLLAIALLTASGAALPGSNRQEQAQPTTTAKPEAEFGELDEPLPPGAVRRYGTLRFRLGYSVDHLAWSADGNRLVTPVNDDLWIWDAATGKVLNKFKDQVIVERSHYPVTQLGISADGSRLATSHYGNGIHVWDFATGKKLCACQGLAFVLSRDGKTLYTGGSRTNFTCSNNEVRYILNQAPMRRWDTTTGKELPALGRGVPFAISLDGKLLAAIAGKVVWARRGPGVDAQFKDQVISLWDTTSGQEIGRLPLQGGVFENGALTPQGLCYHLCPNFGQQRDCLWIWADKQPPRRLPLNIKRVNRLTFSPDGSRVAYNAAPFVHIWDLTSGKEIRQLKLSPGRGTAPLAFASDNQRLAVGGDGAFAVWDLTTGQELATGEGHKAGIQSATLSRDGRLLCTSGRDGVIHLWDRRTGRIVRSLKHPRHDSFGKAVFSPDGRFIAATGQNLFVWEAATGKQVQELSLPSKDGVGCPTFSPDGKFLAAGGWNHGELALWETTTGKNLQRAE